MPLIKLTDADHVADAAFDIKAEAYPSWSIDQFLCHPTEALTLCKAVRIKLHRRGLTDFEILWTLVNARKRSRLPTNIVRNARISGGTLHVGNKQTNPRPRGDSRRVRGT
jgi:hypothetical protein